MSIPQTKRQSIRKFIIVISALLFPVTMLYFSPGIVFRGARTGVLSGSYIMFAMLFLSALVVGRAWCGWLCPVAGFCEFAEVVDAKPYGPAWAKRVKYVIWVVWLIAIALVATFIGGGFSSVDPFLGTEMGISIHNVSLIGFYYLVLATIFSTTFLLGRRGFCHTLCWMAPFMVLGRKLSNLMKVRALRLTTGPQSCAGCKSCERACPMGLPLVEMVEGGKLEHPDCILCGACVEACPAGKLALTFRTPSAPKARSV